MKYSSAERLETIIIEDTPPLLFHRTTFNNFFEDTKIHLLIRFAWVRIEDAILIIFSFERIMHTITVEGTLNDELHTLMEQTFWTISHSLKKTMSSLSLPFFAQIFYAVQIITVETYWRFTFMTNSEEEILSPERDL